MNAVVAIGKRYERKRQRDCFAYTVTAAEQRAVRRVIATSKLAGIGGSRRSALMKVANVWFRHRHKDNHIAPGFERLAEMLGVSEATVKRFVRWAEGHGFIVRDKGGVGRGNVSHWRVIVDRILAVLAPNFAASNGDERLSRDGEISDCGKGVRQRQAHIDNKTSTLLPSRQPFRTTAELFMAGRWASRQFLAALIRRLGLVPNVRPERPIAKPIRRWPSEVPCAILGRQAEAMRDGATGLRLVHSAEVGNG